MEFVYNIYKYAGGSGWKATNLGEWTNYKDQLLKVLRSIHDRNVVHRDITPHNICSASLLRSILSNDVLIQVIATTVRYETTKLIPDEGLTLKERFARIDVLLLRQETRLLS